MSEIDRAMGISVTVGTAKYLMQNHGEIIHRILLEMERLDTAHMGGPCWESYAQFAEHTTLPVGVVREVIRAMYEAGHVYYSTAWDDEGYLHGSGYFLTREGHEALNHCLASWEESE